MFFLLLSNPTCVAPEGLPQVPVRRHRPAVQPHRHDGRGPAIRMRIFLGWLRLGWLKI